MDQHENPKECQIQKQLILAIATPALEIMQQDGWDGGERLESLKRALAQLEAALAAHGADPGNEVIGMAVIKAYEFSFELSWKTLKDLLAYGGIDALLPREVLREAFAYGLVQDGQLWIDMLEQRNLMAHTYEVSRAQQALAMIRERFAPALLSLAVDLEQRR
jgi:nucleotidyltransferase substrate binding protein (TIGR01987 family)